VIRLSKPSGKSKELKITTKHVITIDDIKRDPRKIKLLYILEETKGLTEKAIQYLIYYMKESGYDLGYSFVLLGNIPSSKELRNDLVALLYVGVAETNPRRKIVITSLGKELLNKIKDSIPGEEKEQIKKLVEELRVKVAPIDTEVELATRPRRRRRRF